MAVEGAEYKIYQSHHHKLTNVFMAEVHLVPPAVPRPQVTRPLDDTVAPSEPVLEPNAVTEWKTQLQSCGIPSGPVMLQEWPTNIEVTQYATASSNINVQGFCGGVVGHLYDSQSLLTINLAKLFLAAPARKHKEIWFKAQCRVTNKNPNNLPTSFGRMYWSNDEQEERRGHLFIEIFSSLDAMTGSLKPWTATFNEECTGLELKLKTTTPALVTDWQKLGQPVPMKDVISLFEDCSYDIRNLDPTSFNCVGGVARTKELFDAASALRDRSAPRPTNDECDETAALLLQIGP